MRRSPDASQFVAGKIPRADQFVPSRSRFVPKPLPKRRKGTFLAADDHSHPFLRPGIFPALSDSAGAMRSWITTSSTRSTRTRRSTIRSCAEPPGIPIPPVGAKIISTKACERPVWLSVVISGISSPIWPAAPRRKQWWNSARPLASRRSFGRPPSATMAEAE